MADFVSENNADFLFIDNFKGGFLPGEEGFCGVCDGNPVNGESEMFFLDFSNLLPFRIGEGEAYVRSFEKVYCRFIGTWDEALVEEGEEVFVGELLGVELQGGEFCRGQLPPALARSLYHTC